MNFIETLKSVGGVKSCPHTHDGQNMGVMADNMFISSLGVAPCPLCHGTGQILDLAPLLAKPKELETPVFDLIAGLVVSMYPDRMAKGEVATLPGGKTRYRCFDQFLTDHQKNLHVVGPQRAHSLVYEIARQLGGTAVMAEDDYEKFMAEDHDEAQGREAYAKMGYRLSYSIPDTATILFVTDKFKRESMDELESVIRAIPNSAEISSRSSCSCGSRTCRSCRSGILPYILCLVDASHADGVTVRRIGRASIISLHKEKP